MTKTRLVLSPAVHVAMYRNHFLRPSSVSCYRSPQILLVQRVSSYPSFVIKRPTPDVLHGVFFCRVNFGFYLQNARVTQGEVRAPAQLKQVDVRSASTRPILNINDVRGAVLQKKTCAVS